MSPIRFDITGAVATVTLDRPDSHHALTGADLERLYDLFGGVNDNLDLRALVLTATGERTFCSGASLTEIAEQTSGSKDKWTNHPLTDVSQRLEMLRVPTICALNGSVYGGGVELAMACDFRIGTRGMRCFIPPVRVGIHYPPSGLKLLETRLGVSAAKRLILAGETFDETMLAHCDFCDWWADDSAATLALAADKAAELASFAPLAMEGMKRALNQIAHGDLDEKTANRTAAQCWASDDLQEGLKARAEKRAPQFTRK